MRSKERDYFDSIADVFDKRYNVYSKSVGVLRVKRRIDFFAKHCNLGSGSRVLEIGCGTGEYSASLAKYPCSLFCTDISYKMLAKAVEKLQKPSHACFFLSDSADLAFKDNVFDSIVGNSVLHHLDVGRTLGEVYRTLKKDGRFVFSEPNMLNPQISLQKHIGFLRKLSGDSPDETAFVRSAMENTLKSYGFRDINIAPFDFLHPYTPGPFVKIVETIGLALEKVPLIKEIAGSLLITGAK